MFMWGSFARAGVNRSIRGDGEMSTSSRVLNKDDYIVLDKVALSLNISPLRYKNILQILCNCNCIRDDISVSMDEKKSLYFVIDKNRMLQKYSSKKIDNIINLLKKKKTLLEDNYSLKYASLRDKLFYDISLNSIEKCIMYGNCDA